MRWVLLRGLVRNIRHWGEFPKMLEQAEGVVAVSMGGMIAMDWCDRFPEDFSKVVLINSSAGNLTPFYKRLKTTALKSILPLIVKR